MAESMSSLADTVAERMPDAIFAPRRTAAKGRALPKPKPHPPRPTRPTPKATPRTTTPAVSGVQDPAVVADVVEAVVADVVDAGDSHTSFDEMCNVPGEGFPDAEAMGVTDAVVDLAQDMENLTTPMIGPMPARTTHGIKMEPTDEMTTKSRIKKGAKDAAKETEPQMSSDASSSATSPVPPTAPAIQFGSVSQQEE
jgi:hypothetical protein